VRVIVPVYAPQSDRSAASVKETVGETSQSSLAVTLAGSGIGWSHSMVISAGQPVKSGGVVSTTVIVCEQLAWLPHSSVAVHVRVINPVYGAQPEYEAVCSNVTVGEGSQLSVAVTSGGAGIWSHSAVISAGQPDKTGGVLSTTVIVCAQLASFPQTSVAVQVRSSVPVFAQGPLPTHCSLNERESNAQLSTASTSSGQGISLHSAVMSSGHPTSVGGSVSSA